MQLVKATWLAVLGLSALVNAQRRVVFFGDSLTDNGNGIFKLSGGLFPPFPYYKGRFSDGPTWAEYFANSSASIKEVYNYAHGAATTDNKVSPSWKFIDDIKLYSGGAITTGVNTPGVAQQIDTFFADPVASKFNPHQTIFSVFAGFNDYSNIASQGVVVTPTQVATAVMASVQRLAKAGARFIIVWKLTNTSDPFKAHNTVLESLIADFKSKKENCKVRLSVLSYQDYLNLLAVDPNVIKDADHGACLNVTAQTLCGNSTEYQTFDGQHPTRYGHTVLGKYAIENAWDDFFGF
ncbi:GDSL lipase/esterase [Cladochytrium replicatum]|nr:GDSL lipase/esterase [Cladochytrium replicatum]